MCIRDRKNPCSQRYAREEIITAQIREEIKKVSLSATWLLACESQLERERSETKQVADSFGLKLASELSETERKLDALLDLQLSGGLSQSEYLTKKEKLINHKAELTEKITASNQKKDNRFEPLQDFIKTLRQAEKIATEENPEGLRDFLKKIGSNFQIAERTLTPNLKKPYQIAKKWHAVSQSETDNLALSGGHTNWLRGQDSNLRPIG